MAMIGSMSHDAEEEETVTESNNMPKPLDFMDIFNRYYHDNPKSWDYDRKLSVGASSAFQCIRKSHFDKNPKYKQDESYIESWGAFQRGNMMEDDYIVPAMYHAEDHKVSQGFLANAGPDQRTLLKDVLSATPDGLIVDLAPNALQAYGIEDIDGDCVVMEMKSIDPRVQLSEPKEIHVGQTQVQMGLIQDDPDVPFKPMYAVLVYVDCSFFDNVKVFVVKFDPRAYKTAHKRSKKIMNFDLDITDFMAEGKINNQCDLCNYRDACAEVTKDGIPTGKDAGNDLSEEDAATAKVLITAERAARGRLTTAEKEYKSSKAAMSDYIKGKGRKLVRNEDFSVSIGWREGSKSFDKNALFDDLDVVNAKLVQLGCEDLVIDREDYESRGNGYEVVTVRQK